MPGGLGFYRDAVAGASCHRGWESEAGGIGGNAHGLAAAGRQHHAGAGQVAQRAAQCAGAAAATHRHVINIGCCHDTAAIADGTGLPAGLGLYRDVVRGTGRQRGGKSEADIGFGCGSRSGRADIDVLTAASEHQAAAGQVDHRAAQCAGVANAVDRYIADIGCRHHTAAVADGAGLPGGLGLYRDVIGRASRQRRAESEIGVGAGRRTCFARKALAIGTGTEHQTIAIATDRAAHGKQRDGIAGHHNTGDRHAGHAARAVANGAALPGGLGFDGDAVAAAARQRGAKGKADIRPGGARQRGDRDSLAVADQLQTGAGQVFHQAAEAGGFNAATHRHVIHIGYAHAAAAIVDYTGQPGWLGQDADAVGAAIGQRVGKAEAGGIGSRACRLPGGTQHQTTGGQARQAAAQTGAGGAASHHHQVQVGRRHAATAARHTASSPDWLTGDADVIGGVGRQAGGKAKAAGVGRHHQGLGIVDAERQTAAAAQAADAATQ